MKRCKDCRRYEPQEAKLRWSCIVEYLLDESICVEKCDYYIRKRWKFWRPK